MKRSCLFVNESDWEKAGSLLKDARENLTNPDTGRRVSLRDASVECRCSHALLAWIESGKNAPSDELLANMTKVYQVENEDEIRLLYAQPSEEDCQWLFRMWREKLLGER